MVHWGFVYKEKGTLCRYKHLVVVEAKLVGWWGWLGLLGGVARTAEGGVGGGVGVAVRKKERKTFKDDSR